jgi:hypothetical protein
MHSPGALAAVARLRVASVHRPTGGAYGRLGASVEGDALSGKTSLHVSGGDGAEHAPALSAAVDGDLDALAATLRGAGFAAEAVADALGSGATTARAALDSSRKSKTCFLIRKCGM